MWWGLLELAIPPRAGGRDWSGRVVAIDTDRFFVVAANVIGGCQGSTGPRSIAPDGHPWGSRFPAVTIRDHVGAERALADALDIESWALVVGGSMGGMRALEWAVMYPSRVARVAVLASTAAASADQIAWAQPQLLAIRTRSRLPGRRLLRLWRTPTTGLGIARRIAHTTYRSADDLQRRFGRREQDGNPPTGDCRYAVESYLDHHAAKLCARFDANSYLVLTEAMNSHDVGRGRGAEHVRHWPGSRPRCSSWLSTRTASIRSSSPSSSRRRSPELASRPLLHPLGTTHSSSKSTRSAAC
jgi:homoserine O-acetyltransferase